MYLYMYMHIQIDIQLIFIDFPSVFLLIPIDFQRFCYILEPILNDFKHLGLLSWYMEVCWALGATENYFGYILSSFWLQLGSILVPFWLHVGVPGGILRALL